MENFKLNYDIIKDYKGNTIIYDDQKLLCLNIENYKFEEVTISSILKKQKRYKILSYDNDCYDKIVLKSCDEFVILTIDLTESKIEKRFDLYELSENINNQWFVKSKFLLFTSLIKAGMSVFDTPINIKYATFNPNTTFFTYEKINDYTLYNPHTSQFIGYSIDNKTFYYKENSNNNLNLFDYNYNDSNLKNNKSGKNSVVYPGVRGGIEINTFYYIYGIKNYFVNKYLVKA